MLSKQLRESEHKNLMLSQKLEEIEDSENARSLRLGDLLNTRHDYVQMLKDKEARISDLEQEVETLQLRLEHRTPRLRKYDKTGEYLPECESIFRVKNEALALQKEQNKKLMQDLELMAEHLLEQEKKAKQAQQKAASYLVIIQEKEAAIDVLLGRRNRWYQALKDDQIDEALANYLNSRDDPLPIRFIREGIGRYLFGRRRVTMHLEHEKIIGKTSSKLVKTGGGFMTLPQFIDIYTPLELSREKQNALKRDKSPPTNVGSNAVRQFYNLTSYSNK